MTENNKQDTFTKLCKSQLGYDVVKEHYFAKPRKWRFDYAILDKKIAIEVEGGVFKKRTYIDKRTGKLITTTGGRHNSAKGFIGDMEKYNAASQMGWRLLRVTPDKLMTLETFQMIIKAYEYE